MSRPDAIAYHSEHVESFGAQYKDSAAFQERFDIWAGLIARHAVPDGSVIDVGCGVGTFSHDAAHAARDVLGIGGSAAMVRKATIDAPLNARFRVLAPENIPAAALSPVSLVLCSSVLEYVDEFPRCLRIVADLVAEGSHLIISMPNKASWYRRMESLSFALVRRPGYLVHLKTMIASSELRSELEPLGLRLVSCRQYGARLFGAHDSLVVGVFHRWT